ncbi:MAG TPA: acetolactate synthase [Rheinheimera sp.]|uniref:thiamine pyrophosphate-binding protein n=1 Tax=Rheinheimera sp. TaxID=1869214 RepID=UPI000EBE27C7|nr:thiamine pyrophosphate-binding protein [Rheinheimera sp.]HCU64136.1 acetolactate synthase [Rheinheimera sp.]
MHDQLIEHGQQMDKEQVTYADLVVEYLNLLGVDYVFGVPGGAIEPLFNALARSERRGGVRAVVARHEAGAAFMADGYARETGKLGVCCATTGPGATNLLTGVASAYADNVPILVITAQTPLPKFGRRALQDSSCAAIDIVGIFRHCTRYNSLVSHQEQLENKLIAAVMASSRIPAGPVHISIPSDILRTEAGYLPKVRPELLTQQFQLSDRVALEKLIQELSQAKHIALFIGDGCKDASGSIMQLATLLNAPFVSGPMGKRWVDETHPLYRGVFGFAGHSSAAELLADKENKLDLVLAIGAALGELGTSGWAEELINHKLIHIDSSVEHFTRSPMARLHVCGSLPVIFKKLVDEVQQAQLKWGKCWPEFGSVPPLNALGGRSLWRDSMAMEHRQLPFKPQSLFCLLARILPEGTRFFADAGNAWAWAIHYYQRAESNGKFHIAMGLGAMAWAIGAVIGSALGDTTGAAHVCVTGDGAYLMSAQEITVAKQQQLPILFIVLNDGVLGMVMHGQRLGNAEKIGFELGAVDYAALAQALGVDSAVITAAEQLLALDFSAIFQKKAPTLLDIRIDPEEIPPMLSRIQSLQNQSMTPGG